MLNKDQYFTGTIVEIVNPVLYQIKVDIPGISVSVNAFPMRGEIDEPRIGDFVLLRSLDPVFNSYYLYQKIKENDFIGFRSNGKIVDITPDYITVGIFDPLLEYNDLGEPDETEYGGTASKYTRPELTDWVKLDKDGNLEINLRANSTITIVGNNTINLTGENTIKVDNKSNVEITGNSNINVGGDSNISVGGSSNINVEGGSKINVGGSTELKCPDVTITGGKLTVSGTASPGSGPFCALPACLFTGATHTGNIVSGT